MVHWMVAAAVVVILACPACAASHAQVAEQAAAGTQTEEGAAYVDPWGTPVAWSPVPIASSAPGSGVVSAETEEAKPKVEAESTPAPTEPEPPAAAVDLGSDEDNDE